MQGLTKALQYGILSIVKKYTEAKNCYNNYHNAVNLLQPTMSII